MRGSTNAETFGEIQTGGVVTGPAFASGGIAWAQIGRIVMVMMAAVSTSAPGYNQEIVSSGIPTPKSDARATICDGAGANTSLIQIISGSPKIILNNPSAAGAFYGTAYYFV